MLLNAPLSNDDKEMAVGIVETWTAWILIRKQSVRIAKIIWLVSENGREDFMILS